MECCKTKSDGSSRQQENEFIEDVVCKVEDINDNELKIVSLKEYEVLLVKQKGVISALGPKCTHYGAPLVKSVLGDGRLRCQWHGACFNLATGDIEDFPGFDSLPCYKVTTENGTIKVRAKKSELIANLRVKAMANHDRGFKGKNFVVIGGGPAGAMCVETLRQEGFLGGIILVCKENYLPYDRVKASKAMDFEIDKAQFRNEQFYIDNGIDVLKGIEATSVNTCGRRVTLSNGDEIEYNKLFIATGAKSRTLEIPGADLQNVLTIRGYDDAHYANSQLNPEVEVVVIGSSFIGMEIAHYCIDKVKSVTVVSRGTVPLEHIWGERIGSAILKLFEENGLKHLGNNSVTKINDNGRGAVSGVVLKDGRILKCEVLFAGIGAIYNTDFLKGSNVELMPDGSVEINEYLQTNMPNVYAGGDIAYAPVWSHNNIKSVICHFGLAHYHGRKAALNMLYKQDPLRSVPFFWTMFFRKSIRYAGHGKYDDVIYCGDVENFSFIAFFLMGDEVVAVTACGMDPLVSMFAERLAQGRKLFREDLLDDPLAWSKTR